MRFGIAIVATLSLATAAFAETNLVFTSVAPCKVFDTTATNTIFGNGEERTFVLYGNLAAQGGAAAGCGLPGPSLFKSEVTSVLMTYHVSAPTASGNLRARAADAAAANPASAILYKNGVPGSGTVATLVRQ